MGILHFLFFQKPQTLRAINTKFACGVILYITYDGLTEKRKRETS